jgi:acyl-coenzyme A synthetase/AMP-(fatty) acid ligase
MIFWIEKGVEISYDQLLEDLNNDNPISELLGYIYFLRLLKELSKDQVISSIEDLNNYLTEKKDVLSFDVLTSGTTSVSKSIEVKMSNCIRYVKTNKKIKSVWGMGYPYGSYASTQVFFQSLINRETIIYLFGIEFKSSDQIFSNYKITNLSCTPTFLSMLLMNLKKEYPLVLKITTGGEKIKESLIGSFKKTFTSAEYINIYASTETGSLLYSKSEYFSIPEKNKSQIKIENGTLMVHQSLLNKVQITNGGWYNTNDIVEFVNDSQFKFISRSNGYLNTGGFRISPTQIEDKIQGIEGVKDVHVYGKPNSLLGSIICADVIGEGISSKSLKIELKKQSIEKHLTPQIIRIVDSFEHVLNGKKKIMI